MKPYILIHACMFYIFVFQFFVACLIYIIIVSLCYRLISKQAVEFGHKNFDWSVCCNSCKCNQISVLNDKYCRSSILVRRRRMAHDAWKLPTHIFVLLIWLIKLGGNIKSRYLINVMEIQRSTKCVYFRISECVRRFLLWFKPYNISL